VADAGVPIGHADHVELVDEVGDLEVALGDDGPALVVEDCDPGRVVAAVLEPCEAVQEDRRSQAWSRVADDSTHIGL
jgi:hypothetical protein